MMVMVMTHPRMPAIPEETRPPVIFASSERFRMSFSSLSMERETCLNSTLAISNPVRSFSTSLESVAELMTSFREPSWATESVRWWSRFLFFCPKSLWRVGLRKSAATLQRAGSSCSPADSCRAARTLTCWNRAWSGSMALSIFWSSDRISRRDRLTMKAAISLSMSRSCSFFGWVCESFSRACRSEGISKT